MTSKIAVLLLLTFGLVYHNARAQNICRIIIKDTNYNAIPKATLQIFTQGKLQSEIADNNGNVFLKWSGKTAQVKVSSVGFNNAETIVLKATDTVLKIYLIKTVIGLNEVVITGFTKEVKTEKSIYKVNTISGLALQQQGVTNLAEVLQQQANIYLQQDALLGTNLNMQGIGGQNIKILFNGVPINGRENGNIDLRQINITNAERIEIIKGPMSTLYGTDALGGVINIITKSAPNKRRITLQQSAESIRKFNSNIQLGWNKKRHGFALSATRDIFLGHTATDNYERAFLWKPNEQLNTDLVYTYSMAKAKLKFNPSFMRQHVLNLGSPIVDPFSASAIDEHYYTQRFVTLLQADIDLDSNRKLVFTTSYNNYMRIKEKIYKDLGTLQETRMAAKGDQDTARFQDINFRGTFSTDWKDKVNLLAGYEINNQEGQGERLLNKKNSITDVSVFATLPFNMGKLIQLQPSVRISYNSIYQVPAIPSIHARYQITKFSTLRASYAKGFRAPSLKERYLYFVDQNHNVQGNDSLVPETSHHLQLNSNTKITRWKKVPLSIATSTYYNDISNQIVLALTNPIRNDYKYTNIGKFKNVCQEVSVQADYKKLSTTFSTSFNHLFLADSNRGYTNKEFSTQANYTLGKYKTGINLNYRYIHKQALLSVADLTNEASYSSFLPPQNIMDINLAQKFFNNFLTFQCGVRNLFNLTTLTISGAPLQGNHGNSNSQIVGMARNYFAMLRWNL
jgi:outer membrane receptor for ferrienterochelin and colicins